MPKKVPERMCIACREMKAKNTLLRVVRTTEGQLTLDFSGKKPGRGAYICRDAACLQKARKSRAIDRALDVKTDEALWQELQAALPPEGDKT